MPNQSPQKREVFIRQPVSDQASSDQEARRSSDQQTLEADEPNIAQPNGLKASETVVLMQREIDSPKLRPAESEALSTQQEEASSPGGNQGERAAADVGDTSRSE